LKNTDIFIPVVSLDRGTDQIVRESGATLVD